MRTKEDIQEELEELKERKEELESQGDDAEERYEEMIDDCYGEVQIGNITLSPSECLKKCDPIAFNCGFSEWADNEISELESEIEDLEQELKDLEEEEQEEEQEGEKLLTEEQKKQVVDEVEKAGLSGIEALRFATKRTEEIKKEVQK